jgi:glycosyltransferase involved in cell wall biosynthesis
MKASVVINVHGGTGYDQFAAAADSVLRQGYDPLEFVVVVSDAPSLRTDIEREYGDAPGTRIVVLPDDEGLSAARNAGAEAATGDVVVFTDDDVVADPGWVAELMAMYHAYDPVGVGGHVLPLWPDEEPWYLPAEFYWLVGVMHDNFVRMPGAQPVRNTFGCNISFVREAFLDAGGFRVDLGKNQENPLQGEEAELCERIGGEFWYTPDAVVRHRVDAGQLTLRYLITRSFWQGYSKAALAEDMGSESTFLTDLVTEGIPSRLRRPTRATLGELGTLLVLTAAVGAGFGYGRL